METVKMSFGEKGGIFFEVERPDEAVNAYIISQFYTWYSCKYFHNPGNVFKIRDEQKK